MFSSVELISLKFPKEPACMYATINAYMGRGEAAYVVDVESGKTGKSSTRLLCKIFDNLGY